MVAESIGAAAASSSLIEASDGALSLRSEASLAPALSVEPAASTAFWPLSAVLAAGEDVDPPHAEVRKSARATPRRVYFIVSISHCKVREPQRRTSRRPEDV